MYSDLFIVIQQILVAPLPLGGTLLLSYLLGSVPFGLVLTKLAGLGDVRAIGSGNIGATNVLRTGRKDIALGTLILDAGKGAVAVLIAGYFLGPSAAVLAAIGAFLGHLFPVYLGFRGGKGVATFLGLALALHFVVGLIACGVWLAAAVAFRYSSLAALCAVVATPVAAYYLVDHLHMELGAFLAAFIFLKHRQNIQRLVQGTEPKIGKKA